MPYKLFMSNSWRKILNLAVLAACWIGRSFKPKSFQLSLCIRRACSSSSTSHSSLGIDRKTILCAQHKAMDLNIISWTKEGYGRTGGWQNDTALCHDLAAACGMPLLTTGICPTPPLPFAQMYRKWHSREVGLLRSAGCAMKRKSAVGVFWSHGFSSGKSIPSAMRVWPGTS